MFLELILAVALTLAPEPTVPQLWAELQTLRANRDRTMARSGLEREANESRRWEVSMALRDKLLSKPYPIRPGYHLVCHWEGDGDGGWVIREIHTGGED